jgi:hypothetical protein
MFIRFVARSKIQTTKLRFISASVVLRDPGDRHDRVEARRERESASRERREAREAHEREMRKFEAVRVRDEAAREALEAHEREMRKFEAVRQRDAATRAEFERSQREQFAREDEKHKAMLEQMRRQHESQQSVYREAMGEAQQVQRQAAERSRAAQSRQATGVTEAQNSIGAEARARASGDTSSVGRCAAAVREAVESALDIRIDRTNSAADYGPSYERAGFQEIDDNGRYKNGDVMIWGRSGDGEQHGHIQIFHNGTWFSDFEQRDKIPGSRYRNGSSTLYRYGGGSFVGS